MAVPAPEVEIEADPVDEERLESPVTPRYIAADHVDLPLGSFVASVQKTGFRRLHIIGGCARVPGIDYASFRPDEATCIRVPQGLQAMLQREGLRDRVFFHT